MKEEMTLKEFKNLSHEEIMKMPQELYNKMRLEQDIVEKLKKSEQDIERGDVIPADVVFRRIREKYGLY